MSVKAGSAKQRRLWEGLVVNPLPHELQEIVNVLAGQYAANTEVEFSKSDGDQKMELAHVNHFREITTTVHPRFPESDSRVDTIFMVFK